ncbi:MAG: hypothetical protein ACTSV7_09555 [Candidatus Baldrarchaeia archaeon]
MKMKTHPIDLVLQKLQKVLDKNYIESIFRKSPQLRKLYIFLFQVIFFLFPWKQGTKVVKEDWDYLIVLDACRYDYFKALNDIIPGKLEKRFSVGPSTGTWVFRNFSDKHYDIIYVSANPLISPTALKRRPSKNPFKRWRSLGFNPFFHIDNVWRYGWDEKLGTVPPEKVTKAALRNALKYPGKRMIIHYIQPHNPLIFGPKDWVKKVCTGKITIDEVKVGYAKNLQYVLLNVEKLRRKLKGKIVVTADHGQGLGDYWIYKHPYMFIKPLIEIPWLVTFGGRNGKNNS